MLENAIYSILSPEGYSSILWKDASRYKEVAEKMKLTAKDLYDLKIIDKIIKEPKTEKTVTKRIEKAIDKREIEENFIKIANNLKKEIICEIGKLNKLAQEEIVEQRYKKFRNMGEYKIITID